jgi:hypothetical protein
VAGNRRISLKNAVGSSIGVPLAPFLPAAKIEGREERGESREGQKGFNRRAALMAK